MNITHFYVPPSKINKVTYLFGAGASCGSENRPSLPLVKEIPERLSVFRHYFDDIPKTGEITKPENIKIQKELQGEILWLENHCRNHSSIDTFAKKLFLKGDSEIKNLNKLKGVLTLFLIYEQMKRYKDLRYDSFFASILGSGYALPDLRILSWNYDHQFEISFRDFTDKGLLQNQIKLGVITPFNLVSEDNFSIYKLNGSGTFCDKNSKLSEIDPFEREDDVSELAFHIFSLYRRIQNQEIYPAISFAWEEKNPPYVKRNVVELAKEAVKETDVLIIIGYSMPFFNREVDGELIRSMNLKKVYIQDLNSTGIRERLLTIKPEYKTLEIVEKNAIDQFLLPGELTL